MGQWHADPAWRRIDLLSDVHLHTGAPKTFETWRAHLIETPADAVLILGDLFEVWVGDDSRHEGFEADCAGVIAAASSRKSIAFMRGNRDFLVGDAMRRAVGLQDLSDPTVALAFGQRLLLTHGDALCTADADYQRFRREVRGARWQEAFLSLPLPERQRRARAMRDASQAHQSAQPSENWADVDDALATAWLDAAKSATMVHGHTHRPATHDLGRGRVRHVLGDWDFDALPSRARILTWTADGLTPIDLASP